MNAIERIKAALKDKKKGFRGPEGQQQLVGIMASDFVEAFPGTPADDDEVAKTMSKAAAGAKPNRILQMQVDDVYHMLESAHG